MVWQVEQSECVNYVLKCRTYKDMRFNPHENFYRTLAEREGKGRGKASADERVRGLFMSLKSSHEPYQTHLFTVQQIRAEHCPWPQEYSERGPRGHLPPLSLVKQTTMSTQGRDTA